MATKQDDGLAVQRCPINATNKETSFIILSVWIIYSCVVFSILKFRRILASTIVRAMARNYTTSYELVSTSARFTV